jgi:hypothetical protein
MAKMKISVILASLLAAAIVILTSCVPKDCQVSTSCAPSNGGTISPAGGVFKEGNKLTLVASPAKNFQFDYWAGDVSGNTNPLTITMSSNITVVASFSKIMPSLQIQIKPSGSGSVDTPDGNYEAGTSKTITAIPATGYGFDHWGGNASGYANPLIISIDYNKIITAYFVKVYSLTISSSPNDGGIIEPQSGVYPANTPIWIFATPSFPFYFKNWIGTDNNANPSSVTMKSDSTVTAVFAPTVKGTEQKTSGDIGGLGSGAKSNTIVSIPIELKQNEWLQGEITAGTAPPVSANIRDPNGKMLRDFGVPGHANFSLMAQTAGKYTVTFQNSNMFWSSYYLAYTIYGIPH